MDRDSCIRVRKQTKETLDSLDFVKKGHSYNDIVEVLIDEYKKRWVK